MPDTSSPSSPRSFPDDLRRIREERGLTLEALHEETKIPLNVLEEFEETGLFENPMFNRVYLRSLVRTYASYVGVPSKVMLEALDEALLHTYQGSLAVQYLGEAPPATPKPAEAEPPPAAADATPEAPAEEAPEATEAAAPAETAAPAEDAASKPVASEPEENVPDEPAEAAPPARSSPRMLKTTGTSWAAQSPGPRAQRRSRRAMDVRRRASYTQWVLIGGVVVVFAGVIWALLSFINRPTDTTEPQAALPDTAAVDTVPPPPPRPRLVVGDTLDVVVVAVQKVERIHVKRDDDARRPYWIEEGVATVFPALERIVLEDRLDRIRLLVEGFEYPTTIRDDQNRIVITRADIQAFADTLTAMPVQLPAPPDTIPMMPVAGR